MEDMYISIANGDRNKVKKILAEHGVKFKEDTPLAHYVRRELEYYKLFRCFKYDDIYNKQLRVVMLDGKEVVKVPNGYIELSSLSIEPTVDLMCDHEWFVTTVHNTFKETLIECMDYTYTMLNK